MPDAAISVTSAPQWATDTSSIRGLFAGTESGGKHAACRPRINAIADDRSFVALQASGSADTQQRGRAVGSRRCGSGLTGRSAPAALGPAALSGRRPQESRWRRASRRREPPRLPCRCDQSYFRLVIVCASLRAGHTMRPDDPGMWVRPHQGWRARSLPILTRRVQGGGDVFDEDHQVARVGW